MFPHLAYLDLPVLTKVEDADYSLCDLVFCALPHGTTQEVIAALPNGLDAAVRAVFAAEGVDEPNAPGDVKRAVRECLKANLPA